MCALCGKLKISFLFSLKQHHSDSDGSRENLLSSEGYSSSGIHNSALNPRKVYNKDTKKQQVIVAKGSSL